MSWLSVSFEVGAAGVEAVTDALLEAGALAVDVEDAAAGSALEEPLFAEGGEPARAWQRSVVRALIAADADAGRIVAAACGRAGMALPPHRVRVVPGLGHGRVRMGRGDRRHRDQVAGGHR